MTEETNYDVEPSDVEHADVEHADVESAGLEDVTAAGARVRRVQRLVPAVLAVLLVVSAAFAGTAYFVWYRPDHQVGTVSADTVVKAASDGAVAMLTYAPESMDKDFANAKAHLTGDFLNYYTKFTETVVTPAVKEKAVKTQATIARAAVSELHQDTALVLAFINQVTVSKQNPDGSFAQSSVKIGMSKVNGNWLISAFDPI